MNDITSLSVDKAAAAKPVRFQLTPFDEIQPGTAPAYLVPEFIPRVGLSVVYGAPKCGKTYWVLDVALHVALGWDYRGRKVREGRVVYFGLEGRDGLKKRIVAFRKRHLWDGYKMPFELVTDNLDLIADQDELVAAIEAGTPPVLVVLDTLNRSLKGSENDDKDMARYIEAAEAIADRFECAVVVIHHTGHEGTHPRGHSSLMGAVVAQLRVRQDSNDNIEVEVERMKDGDHRATVTSRLEEIVIGIDDNMDELRSCVLVDAPHAPASDEIGLTTLEQEALSLLSDLVMREGKSLPTGITAVALEIWKQAMYQSGIGDPATSAGRMRVKRLVDKMAKSGEILISGGYVSRTLDDSVTSRHTP